MGCTGSKLDDLPALALCRDRTALLESAIRFRYALSQSHLSYTQSLHALGLSLHRFFDVDAYDGAPLSPVLPLPTQRKLAPDPGPDLPPPAQITAASAAAALHHSHSSSGSHLNFHPTDSDSDSEGHSSLHGDLHDFVHDEGMLPPSPPVQYRTYYMQNRPTVPTVETVQVGEPSSSYAYPYYANFNYGGYGGFFGSPPPMMQQQQQQMMPPMSYGYYGSSSSAVAPMAEASSSSRQPAPPPPPPPPPSSSAWDFLNVFNAVENSYSTPYTPSRDSKEVREEEGIPDLEDEDNQEEVVKEVHGEQKFVGDGGDGGRFAQANDGGIAENASYLKSRGVEFEVHMVEKNAVADEERVAESRKSNVAPAKGQRRPRGISEVVEEIGALFDRASESGSEVSKLLEVGKLPYRGKSAAYKVPSKMLDAITPLPMLSSQPSTSKSAGELPSSEDVGSLSLGYHKEIASKSVSLSSALERLYIWEKKLYDEVKAEEKMRIMHERKSRRLKHLDERVSNCVFNVDHRPHGSSGGYDDERHYSDVNFTGSWKKPPRCPALVTSFWLCAFYYEIIMNGPLSLE
ncbi:hypothetical protein ACLOJK_002329 [Asimina triloba]